MKILHCLMNTNLPVLALVFFDDTSAAAADADAAFFPLPAAGAGAAVADVTEDAAAVGAASPLLPAPAVAGRY